MNTPNPLVPQGTKPAIKKSTIRIVVFTIIVVHVALIGGFLIQGCSPDKHPTEPASTSTDTVTNLATAPVAATEPPPLGDTNALPSTLAGTPAPVNTAVAGVSTSAVPVVTAPAPLPPVVETPAPVAPASSDSSYAVAKGDTLATIAHKHGVTTKALQDANPGVDSRKLKIGQKLVLPAAPVAVTPPSNGGAAVDASAPAASDSVYTVKSGDVLLRVAKAHGTTVNAIKAANNLKSTSLKPGQKLKMPAPKAATPVVDAAAPAVSSLPVSTPMASPVTTPMATPAPLVPAASVR